MEVICFVCCKLLGHFVYQKKPPIFKMFLFPRIPFGKSVKKNRVRLLLSKNLRPVDLFFAPKKVWQKATNLSMVF